MLIQTLVVLYVTYSTVYNSVGRQTCPQRAIIYLFRAGNPAVQSILILFQRPIYRIWKSVTISAADLFPRMMNLLTSATPYIRSNMPISVYDSI